MTTVNVYLTFGGNCESAFEFYKSVFGGEFSYIGRYKDMPPMEGCPSVSVEDSEKIMHVGLSISKETMLMGCDNLELFGQTVCQGNNFSIMVSADSKESADRIYNLLAIGGTVTMPIDDMFWGDYYGSLTDKFGINWMVSFSKEQ